MPRDGSGVYSKPFGTTAVPGNTAEAATLNDLADDLVTDANVARPISAGGTGAGNASGARSALGIGPIATLAAQSASGLPYYDAAGDPAVADLSAATSSQVLGPDGSGAVVAKSAPGGTFVKLSLVVSASTPAVIVTNLFDNMVRFRAAGVTMSENATLIVQISQDGGVTWEDDYVNHIAVDGQSLTSSSRGQIAQSRTEAGGGVADVSGVLEYDNLLGNRSAMCTYVGVQDAQILHGSSRSKIDVGMNALRFIPTAGLITGGRFLVHGVKVEA